METNKFALSSASHFTSSIEANWGMKHAGLWRRGCNKSWIQYANGRRTHFQKPFFVWISRFVQWFVMCHVVGRLGFYRVFSDCILNSQKPGIYVSRPSGDFALNFLRLFACLFMCNELRWSFGRVSLTLTLRTLSYFDRRNETREVNRQAVWTHERKCHWMIIVATGRWYV